VLTLWVPTSEVPHDSVILLGVGTDATINRQLIWCRNIVTRWLRSISWRTPYLGARVSSDRHCIFNFVRRNSYGCSPDAKALAYISLITTQLGYAALRPPTCHKHISIGKCTVACCVLCVIITDTLLLERLLLPIREGNKLPSYSRILYIAINYLIGILTTLLQLKRPSCTSRNSYKITFIPLSCDTIISKDSFFPRRVTEWNQLSRDRRYKPSVDSFRAPHTVTLPSPPCRKDVMSWHANGDGCIFIGGYPPKNLRSTLLHGPRKVSSTKPSQRPPISTAGHPGWSVVSGQWSVGQSVFIDRQLPEMT